MLAGSADHADGCGEQGSSVEGRLSEETAASAAAADCPVGEAGPLRLRCDLWKEAENVG